MTQHFFVLGQQRSRTAWMANLLTHGESSFCFHDGVRMSKDPPVMDGVFASVDGYQYVGDSDNALALYADDVLDRYPDAPAVVIRRDSAAVARSLEAMFPNLSAGTITSMIEQTEAGLDTACTYDNVIEVECEKLDSITELERVWAHLLPDVPFLEQRARHMAAFNVQLEAPVYVEKIEPEFRRSLELMGMV